MVIETLQDVLESAADAHQAHCGLVAYPPGSVDNWSKLRYGDLRTLAQSNASSIRLLKGFVEGSVILLHFVSNLDSIVWFWSVLYAGCVPAMSTPFSHNPRQRQNHLNHLHTLLKDPLCITTVGLLKEFEGQHQLKLQVVDNIPCLHGPVLTETITLPSCQPDDLALLMLTSGSTGNAKAVALKHRQIIASVSGKAAVRDLQPNSAFLNWVGLDHVASIVETHLQAMYLCMDQVHVQAADIIANPRHFLTLIERHDVSRSFAPNFFLAMLRQTLESDAPAGSRTTWNLTALRFLGSGGEANPVDTCDALSGILSTLGAPKDVIVPGFGMTETCAGAIYNTSCPNYDLEKRLEFTSLGPCMPGIEMRVVVPSEHCRLAERNEAGNLEVTGPVVFQKYFNDQTATANAFTADGWFRTGDRAIIDSAGNLNLVGRGKEVMNINGVKHAPHELESALEEALIAWAKPSYLVSFSYRPRRSQTEDICVVYVPRYPAEDVESRVQAYDTAVRTVLLQTGVRPRVVPVEESLLQKSTLGKLSRTKIKTSFECGEYNFHEETNNNVVKAYRASHITPPKNGKERLLLKEFSAALNLPDQEIGVETHLFELGVTSIDLIKMARRVEERLQLHVRIPILTMMANPTVRSLSRALERMQASRCDFDPVVVLQPRGPKTPLWLIHPGVGEVLVFLNLAKHFTDRPIFALRARGFEPGESYFRDIDEAVQTYRAAIKERQPTGPYLIAGYSYGAMLAFEVAKTLEAIGDEVPFLGCFNLPPHIKTRMRQLDWTECLVNLAYFLDLVTEDHAHALSPQIRTLGRPQAVAHVLEIAAPARVADLSLTAQALENWAGLAHGLQGMARDYEPSGSVAAVDVFYCQPLSIVAATKEEWLQDHLSKWADFCRTRPRFHAVEGSHYTIIGQTHVFGFQKVLKQALKARRL